MDFTRLANETDDYRKAREELRLAEIELMRHREEVARLRRALPPGTVVADYEFVDARHGTAVRLSELVTAPGRPLVVYHLMYGKKQTEPCVMCTQWIDGFNGIAHHLARNVDFVVAAAAEPDALLAHARNREWNRLRLLSCGSNTFQYDLGAEDEDGNQDSHVSVYVRDDEGNVRHTYSTEPRLADDIDQRGIDLLCATWHVLDLTPPGRGDWYSSLSYGVQVAV
jgi:predicted dithiol-disulfide oxidoreductase (DUF899 family)